MVAGGEEHAATNSRQTTALRKTGFITVERTLTGTPTDESGPNRSQVALTPGVSRKTGSVKIPAQGPLYGTFDEVVYAPRLTLHYVASRLLDG